MTDLSPAEQAFTPWLAHSSANPFNAAALRDAFLAGWEAALQWSIDEETNQIAWDMALEDRPVGEDAKERLRKHVARVRQQQSRANSLNERLEAEDD